MIRTILVRILCLGMSISLLASCGWLDTLTVAIEFADEFEVTNVDLLVCENKRELTKKKDGEYYYSGRIGCEGLVEIHYNPSDGEKVNEEILYITTGLGDFDVAIFIDENGTIIESKVSGRPHFSRKPGE